MIHPKNITGEPSGSHAQFQTMPNPVSASEREATSTPESCPTRKASSEPRSAPSKSPPANISSLPLCSDFTPSLGPARAQKSWAHHRPRAQKNTLGANRRAHVAAGEGGEAPSSCASGSLSGERDSSFNPRRGPTAVTATFSSEARSSSHVTAALPLRVWREPAAVTWGPHHPPASPNS